MADLMVALIGPGRGPNVPLNGRGCVVRVSGIVDGVLIVRVDGERVKEIRSNGNSEILAGGFVSLEYDGNAKTLIAEVVRKS